VSSLVIGETLNNQYRIVRQMGGGGMGAVYEGEELSNGRRVAIKVISTGDSARDKALLGRFNREAKATMSIDTDHIVRLFDAGTDAATGQPFMVMEYLSGEDLSHLFKRLGPLPPDLALRIVAQACIGLEKAHEARVVHRDIKPANLFLAVEPDGRHLVKLLDFGIAKIKMDQAEMLDSKSLTRTGSMIGSPLYMSPEQARGSKTIDHRADIWSMGIVLYQALSGRTPYQDIEALGELIIAICSESPRPVQDLSPWVPPEVASIVHRALRFEPGERFQTATEMLATLRALLPDGSEIRPEMIVSVSAEMRAHQAPRLEPLSTAPRAMTPSMAMMMRPDAVDPALAATTPAPEMPTPMPQGPRVTPSPSSSPSQSQSPSPSSSRSTSPSNRTPLLAVAAVVVAAAAGFGVYKVMAPPPASGNAIPTATATATAMAIPTATAIPTAIPTATANVKTVSVAIAPADAQVEVEGAAVPLKDGAISLSGALGSVHRVRVFKGKDQTTEDVVVTAGGPVPAKIELKDPKKKGPR
jgi:eukaryotic-like serine/threonine-protein kinase